MCKFLCKRFLWRKNCCTVGGDASRVALEAILTQSHRVSEMDTLLHIRVPRASLSCLQYMVAYAAGSPYTSTVLISLAALRDFYRPLQHITHLLPLERGWGVRLKRNGNRTRKKFLLRSRRCGVPAAPPCTARCRASYMSASI